MKTGASSRRYLVKRCWKGAYGYWKGRKAFQAWLLLATATLIVVFQLTVQYRLSFWSRELFNAIERKDQHALAAEAIAFAPLALASLSLALIAVWSRMTIDREWRRWFSEYLYDYWVENDGHIRLRQLAGEHQTPEYRIADDARVATDLPVDLALGFLTALLTACTFISVLWSAGGSLQLDLRGIEITIDGYLVVAVALYGVMLTSATLAIGRSFANVSEANKASEAELRAAGAALRSAGESLIGPQMSSQRRRDVALALTRVSKNWRDLCFQVLRMTLISHLNMLVAPSIGLLLCAPKYLSGEMSLGAVVQAASAFVAVQGAFNWATDNYGRVVEWITSATRVGSLLVSLDQINGGVRQSTGTDSLTSIETADNSLILGQQQLISATARVID